jgi:hypothetical protein
MDRPVERRRRHHPSRLQPSSIILALACAAALGAEKPSTAILTGDLDGAGSPKTITATPRGGKIRLDVVDARGKRLARAEAPSPKTATPRLELDGGSLASAGILVQLAVSDAGGNFCRTFWRYRDRRLSQVPLVRRGSPLPDCAHDEGWNSRWVQSRPDGPADYVRERTRLTSGGAHHQTEAYRYTGFRLELDTARSSAQIAGVTIPRWLESTLYPRPALERLFSRFDLSILRTCPKLRIQTDPEEGVFAATLERPQGTEHLTFTAETPGNEKDEIRFTVHSGEQTGSVQIHVAPDGSGPVEVLLRGFDDDTRAAFIPVTRQEGSRLRLYATAEQELAVEALSGLWDASNGDHLEVSVVSLSPLVVRFGGSELSMEIARAPEGTDLALIPRNASGPTWALRLRGPNVFDKIRVSCPEPGAVPKTPCRTTEGTGQLFHRLGASIAVH